MINSSNCDVTRQHPLPREGAQPCHTPVYGAIACDVMRDEILASLEEVNPTPRLILLPQGLHNTPDDLRREVGLAIAHLETDPTCTRIALVYGLCSRGLEGVAARRATLALPRAHDCITLLLGDAARYRAWMADRPGTYWYSPGWNRSHHPPGPERFEAMRQHYLQRFDPEQAEDLVMLERESLAHYTTAAWIDQGTGVREADIAYSKACAEWMGWSFERIQGDRRLIADLLAGNWDDHRYQIARPGTTFRLSADERVVESVTLEGKPLHR